MDERCESNILEERRAFTGPAHDKGDPHKDHFCDCHPSDLFPRGALKELITPYFSLPSIPNLCVFCPFPFTLIPGCSLGCPCLCARGFTCFPVAGALQASLFLLCQTVQFHIPGGLCPSLLSLTGICPGIKPVVWRTAPAMVVAAAARASPTALSHLPP